MKYIKLLILVVVFSSCKERIDVNLDENIGKLIIEAEVHDGPGPYYVKTSTSTSFNSGVAFLPHPITSIIITDNEGNRDSLVKHADGIYKTTSLQGKVGNTYFITVNDNGVKYTAQSRLNSSPVIDSSYVSYFLTKENLNPTIVFRDPASEENYYRYFVRRNNQSAEFMYIFEDKLINGTKWRLTAFREDFKVGDSCEMFMLGIDKANFEYFNILVQNLAAVSGGNESAAPTNPPTNFSSNDVLGYFSAHSKKSAKFVIK